MLRGRLGDSKKWVLDKTGSVHNQETVFLEPHASREREPGRRGVGEGKEIQASKRKNSAQREGSWPTSDKRESVLWGTVKGNSTGGTW